MFLPYRAWFYEVIHISTNILRRCRLIAAEQQNICRKKSIKIDELQSSEIFKMLPE